MVLLLMFYLLCFIAAKAWFHFQAISFRIVGEEIGI